MLPNGGSSTTDESRRRFLGLVGAGASLGLSGCFGSDNQTDEIHLLTNYFADVWQDRWENEIIPGYEEEYGTSVNIEYTGRGSEVDQRLATLIQSGETPNAFNSTPNQAVNAVLQGQTAPVTDVVEENVEKYGEVTAAETITYDGEFHGIPHGVYLYGSLHYRKDIYDQLSLDPPDTWDDLLTNVRAIDEEQSFDTRGISVPGGTGSKPQIEFQQYLGTAGAAVFRWTDDSQSEAEVWLPREESIETLQFMEDLAQYSPDPSSGGWSKPIEWWIGDRIANYVYVNAYVAGLARGAGKDELVRNTDITPLPVKEGADYIDRGIAQLHNFNVLDTEGVEDTKDFFRYMMENPDRMSGNYVDTEPMRLLPAYQNVVDQDYYQNADIWQEYDGHLLELMEKCNNELAPTQAGEERVVTAPTQYAMADDPLSDMVNKVLVQGKSKETAYEEAREELTDRLEEGKQRQQ